MTATQDLFIVKLASFDREQYTQGELRVYKNRQLIESRPVALNTSISLEKENLPEGLLRLELTLGEKNLKERLIWNGPLGAWKRSSGVERKLVLEEANRVFQLKDSALVSVSIEKVDQPSQLLGMQTYCLLENKLKLNLPASFYESMTAEQLDAVLVFAQWSAPKEMPDEVKRCV